jgi:hypothetical protein
MFAFVQMEHLVSHAVLAVSFSTICKFHIIGKKIDSTRNPFALPTIPPQSSTPMASLLFNNNGKYGGNNNNIIQSASACSPSSREACNGGQCILVGGSIYTCRCREGYTGVYCENS